MKKIILYFIFLFSISCSQTSLIKPSDKNDYFAKAENYFKQRELSKARKFAEKFIEKEPENFKGYETLLKIFEKQEIKPKELLALEQKYLKLIAQINLPDSLSLQVKYIFETAIEDSSAEAILDTIISKYPTCNITNQSGQEKIFEYAIMRDDSLRVEELNKFLQKYEKNKWSALGWRYLLFSYENMGEEKKLDSLLTFLGNNFSDSPKMINMVARYYLNLKEKLDFCEDKMKMIISQVERTEDKPAFEFWRAKTKGERLAKYRFTLAQILYENKKYEEVLDELSKVEHEDLTAKFYYLMGKTEMHIDQKSLAFTHLLTAVKMGDERNHWTPRADSLLKEIYLEFSNGGDDSMQFTRVWAKYKGPIFRDVTNESGLSDYKKTRIAWGDYNNDGYDDILLNGNTLLRNNKDGTFSDISEEAGISEGKTNGGVWADIDRDGYLDFFATSSNTSKSDILWKNLGDGTFLDITESTPIADTLQTEGAAWGDIDGDLLPDLYLANYERWEILDNEPDFLFHNEGLRPDGIVDPEGNGEFSDVTELQKIIPPFGENQAGRGVNWGDYNNDGFLDIFVSNYRLDRNFLWKNQKGKSFENVAEQVGVEGNYVDGWYGHTIGSEWGDFDNDGDMDLICANLAHPRFIEFSDMTMLFVNDLKNKKFVDIRESAGITYDECHSDPSWGDVNSDGYLDLFITSIYPNRRSYLYLNNRDKTFTDITFFAGVRTFNSWGAAFSDYDNDGDLDLLVCSSEGIHLFRNESEKRNWLEIQILDKNGKTPIIGTRVEVTQDKLKQIREVEGGKGTTNQHSQTLYFGFPSEDDVDIQVRYLDGKIINLKNQGINRIIRNVYN
ncbi:MAG: VCBS repeat-containing protein [Candidatus Cloacimonetes bacterium]|nr:VCBS repeat-containing protein [Candidatus Cloacimonadota bacterium]